MSSKSLSSAAKAASKAASSALTSGTSSAASAASEASASLASGSAKASSYAGKVAEDVPAKAAGIFSVSTLTLTAFAIAVAAAYYNGYLDNLIAYIQQLMGQAQDQKDQIMKENTGTTSIRAAAKDKMNQGTVRTNEMVDQLHAKAQRQETGRVQNIQTDGPVSMLSDQTH